MFELYKNPIVWHKPLWIFIFCLAINFTKTPNYKDKHNICIFFKSLCHVCPCPFYRAIFQKFLSKHPIEKCLKRKKVDLLKYVIHLYNSFVVLCPYSPKIKNRETVENFLKMKCLERKKTTTTKSPYIWGYYTWLFLHCCSFAFPESATRNDENHYTVFIFSLSNLLPCHSCCVHMKEYLEKRPIYDYLDNREEFVAYLIQMHNFINNNYKKSTSYTIKDAKKIIMENCRKEMNLNKKFPMFI